MIRYAWFCVIALGIAAPLACAGSEEASGNAAGSGGTGGSDAGTSDSAKGGSAGSKDAGAVKGAPCSDDIACASGSCVDGVCCDGVCAGECESCKVVGKEGTCSPVAAGTDPDTECGDPTAQCSGKCDGAGACEYPGAEQTCGATSCTAGKQTGSACDGTGQCTSVETSCGLYQCDGTTCGTTCATEANCTTDAYCATNVCAAKKTNGKSCGDAKECTSAVCSQSVCCNVDCAAPSDCSTGTCSCNGVACAAGDKCITWYIDVDKDGFGSTAKTALGCEATGPNDGQTYAKNKDDCLDTNSNVKPGQTAWFTTERGDGSYDYDCDTLQEPQYKDVTGLVCADCGIQVGAICYNCGTIGAFNTYAFGCNASNKCTTTGEVKGYTKIVGCGQSEKLVACAQCSSTVVTDPTPTQQGCH